MRCSERWRPEEIEPKATTLPGMAIGRIGGFSCSCCEGGIFETVIEAKRCALPFSCVFFVSVAFWMTSVAGTEFDVARRWLHDASAISLANSFLVIARTELER